MSRTCQALKKPQWKTRLLTHSWAGSEGIAGSQSQEIWDLKSLRQLYFGSILTGILGHHAKYTIISYYQAKLLENWFDLSFFLQCLSESCRDHKAAQINLASATRPCLAAAATRQAPTKNPTMLSLQPASQQKGVVSLGNTSGHPLPSPSKSPYRCESPVQGLGIWQRASVPSSPSGPEVVASGKEGRDNIAATLRPVRDSKSTITLSCYIQKSCTSSKI